MNFDMKKPCSNCPFLKSGGIRLHQKRVREIAAALLDSQGRTFTCHRTTVDSDDDERGMVDGPNATHCAGALIFAEKNGNQTQMMRIAERMRWYDPGALMEQKEIVGSVFGSLKEMLKANKKELLR